MLEEIVQHSTIYIILRYWKIYWHITI